MADVEKSIDLATKISVKAEDALSRLTMEMAIMKWPAEFRAIMWETVADIAHIRAQEARKP
jgi:hypothetical protein